MVDAKNLQFSEQVKAQHTVNGIHDAIAKWRKVLKKDDQSCNIEAGSPSDSSSLK